MIEPWRVNVNYQQSTFVKTFNPGAKQNSLSAFLQAAFHFVCRVLFFGLIRVFRNKTNEEESKKIGFISGTQYTLTDKELAVVDQLASELRDFNVYIADGKSANVSEPEDFWLYVCSLVFSSPQVSKAFAKLAILAAVMYYFWKVGAVDQSFYSVNSGHLALIFYVTSREIYKRV